MLLGVVSARSWVYTVAAIAVMALLLLSARYFYSRGYEASETKWQLQVAEERERVRKANEEAENLGRNMLENYVRSVRSRDARIATLESEVMASPDAVNSCLPTDFVRRLNQIR